MVIPAYNCKVTWFLLTRLSASSNYQAPLFPSPWRSILRRTLRPCLTLAVCVQYSLFGVVGGFPTLLKGTSFPFFPFQCLLWFSASAPNGASQNLSSMILWAFLQCSVISLKPFRWLTDCMCSFRHYRSAKGSDADSLQSRQQSAATRLFRRTRLRAG